MRSFCYQKIHSHVFNQKVFHARQGIQTYKVLSILNKERSAENYSISLVLCHYIWILRLEIKENVYSSLYDCIRNKINVLYSKYLLFRKDNCYNSRMKRHSLNTIKYWECLIDMAYDLTKILDIVFKRNANFFTPHCCFISNHDY